MCGSICLNFCLEILNHNNHFPPIISQHRYCLCFGCKSFWPYMEQGPQLIPVNFTTNKPCYLHLQLRTFDHQGQPTLAQPSEEELRLLFFFFLTLTFSLFPAIFLLPVTFIYLFITFSVILLRLTHTNKTDVSINFYLVLITSNIILLVF